MSSPEQSTEKDLGLHNSIVWRRKNQPPIGVAGEVEGGEKKTKNKQTKTREKAILWESTQKYFKKEVVNYVQWC